MSVRAILSILVAAATAVTAQVLDWPEVRLASAALTALLIVNVLWSQFSLRGLRVRRYLESDRVQVGDRLTDTLEVHNPGLLGRLWVELHDHSELPGHDASRIFSIRRRSVERWTVVTTVLRRGKHRIGPVELRSGDLFNTFHKRVQLRETIDILAYPLIFDLPGYSPPSALHSGGQARHVRSTAPTPTVGGARDYVHGDPINRISWSLTARTGKLMVKEFETDPTSDVWIVLDVNMSGGEAPVPPGVVEDPVDYLTTSFELAVSAAASVMRACLDGGRAVGLLTSAAQPVVIPPERSDRQYVRCLEWLATIEPTPGFDLMALLTSQHGRFRRDASVVVITEEGHGDLPAYLASLRIRRVYADVAIIDGASFGERGAVDQQLEALASSLVRAHVLRYGEDVGAALRSPVLDDTLSPLGRIPDAQLVG